MVRESRLRVEARLSGAGAPGFRRSAVRVVWAAAASLEHPWRLPDRLEQVPEVPALAQRVRRSVTGKRVVAAYARRRDDPVLGRHLQTIAAG